IFLGLRGAKLRSARVRNDLAEDIRQRLRWKDRLHAGVEIVRILRHPDRAGELDDARPREAGKTRIEDRPKNLAHAVGAEIEAEHAVAVTHADIVADDRGEDELVEFLLR